MDKYKIFFNIDELENLFKKNPFSLKHDFKSMGVKLKDENKKSLIVENISNEIARGSGKKANVILLEKRIDNSRITICKVRVSIDERVS